MSGHEDGDAVAVDLDRMNVQQLTALIEAAEAKRRDKLEEAIDPAWVILGYAA